MNTMNALDRMSAMALLREHAWTHAISVDARDPTLGGLWISITEAMNQLTKKRPSFRYWLCGSVGLLTEKPHYHGLLWTDYTQRDIQRAFKGCNSPTLKELYDVERWCDYVVKQGMRDTIITNLGE